VPSIDETELRELFHSEVAERCEKLVEGARSFASGDADSSLAHDLFREGHTIKGTARMMEYTAVSDAGKLLEDTWRSIDDGEITVTRGLARSLEKLAAELPAAVDADPETGTAGLAEAVRLVRKELRSEDAFEQGDDIGTRMPEGGPATPDAGWRAPDGSDLGGLLGVIDTFAFGENVRVNAANLFRLINEVCSLRVDAEALGNLVADITRSLDDPEQVRECVGRLAASVAAADKVVHNLQGQAIQLAATPLSEITNTFHQLVRYLARKAGKDIRFELVGDEFAVDRQVLERLSDPLRHLLVNAVDHGVEKADARVAAGKPPTATLALRASVEDNRLTIVVEDDGRGIDWDAVQRSAIQRGLLPPRTEADVEALRSLLFSPNFSTAVPGELVGDGNGLATVAEAVESLRGSLRLETKPGKGTRVTLTVPTSRALQDVVLITAAGQTWGIPEIAVLDQLPLDSVDLDATSPRAEMTWRGARIPVISFAETVGLVESEPPSRVLVVSSTVGPVGFMVTSEIGRRQVAARELGPILDGIPHLTGAVLLGGGDVVVVVDPNRLAERARAVPDQAGPRPRVLVVDDSRGARQVVGGALGSAGFEVDLAGSPTEALSAIAEQSFDAIVVDYVLPTMDGATLVRKIRELGVDAAVVVLSGLATAEDQSKVIEAGADAYFDKDDVRKGALAAALSELVTDRSPERSPA
jgi:two-component system chemotaxis sensor kinase CheA